MTAPTHQLTVVEVGDDPSAWAAAGFTVVDGCIALGATTVRCTGTGGGVVAWAVDGVGHPVDGIPAATPVRTGPTGPGAHPNGVTRLDHVVVMTGDGDRTVAALGAAGLELRGSRATTLAGRPTVQRFLWAGDVIVEVVAPTDPPAGPAGAAPATIWGLTLVAADLDTTAAFLGNRLGRLRDAVQPGRRIAALRTRDLGIGVAVAVMSPHVRSPDGGSAAVDDRADGQETGTEASASTASGAPGRPRR